MQLTTKQLERKKELCTEMMKVLDLLQPGRTSRRGNYTYILKYVFFSLKLFSGIILYEFHMALMLLGKMKLSSDPGAKKDLKKSLECLKESLDILKDESQDSFANKLYVGAKSSFNDVEVFIKSLLK